VFQSCRSRGRWRWRSHRTCYQSLFSKPFPPRLLRMKSEWVRIHVMMDVFSFVRRWVCGGLDTVIMMCFNRVFDWMMNMQKCCCWWWWLWWWWWCHGNWWERICRIFSFIQCLKISKYLLQLKCLKYEPLEIVNIIAYFTHAHSSFKILRLEIYSRLVLYFKSEMCALINGIKLYWWHTHAYCANQ